MPIVSFVEDGGGSLRQYIVSSRLERIMPITGFEQTGVHAESESDKMTLEMILMAEAQEHAGESLPQDRAELEALFQEENRVAAEQGQSAGAGQSPEQIQTGAEQSGNAASSGNGFVAHQTKLAQVDMTLLQDYETLVSRFYTIDKSTMIGSDQLNTEDLYGKDMTVSKDAEGPQILIYHTHSQEAFADSVPGDTSTGIVGVGSHLADILTNQYGYEVLHHTASYDLPSRDDAYSVALPDIEKVLEENPQIQVVIDLHRDAMDESTRLVMDLDGRPTARFMFFNGLSRTRKTGNIAYLYNENLDSNLAFSFQLQKVANEYYPGLTRKIYLKAYRYNMHLRPKNLLIELGAQNNTVEEAMNACDPIAHILDMVLSGQSRE